MLAVWVSLLCLFFYSNTARAFNPAYPDLTYWEQWAINNAYTISNYVYSEGTTTGQDGEIGNEFVCIRDDVNRVIIGRPDVCGTYYNGLGYDFADITTDPTQLTAAPDIIDSVTGNLIDQNLANWGGCYYTGQNLGGQHSYVPGGSMPNCGQNIINWSYGGWWVYRRHAIEQALKQAGVNVDGYTWKFTIKNLNGDRADQAGIDTLDIRMRIWDNSGNEVHQKQWLYNWKFDWTTFQGTELFNNPLIGENLSSWQLQMYGRDSGNWWGYYGPEMLTPEINMIYSSNPCAVDPLLHPDCEGYVDAYANYLYDQNCIANPLYDSGCPGYQQAYYDQQCSINPLYDTGCSGYAQAYFDQQCSIDALYDEKCSGYAEAYLAQQCSLDALYDATCPGYAEAYAKEYILNAETTSPTETVSTTSETLPTITSAETLTETPVTGDATVDAILGDLNEVPTTSFTVETSSVETTPTESETQEAEETTEENIEVAMLEEGQDERETESDSNVDEQMEDSGDEESSDGEQSSEGSSDADSGGDNKSKQSSSKKDTKSKKEKMKEEIAKKAMQLAENMSNAASLEAQQAVQAQVLALINYVPDFNKYNTIMNGGYMPDGTGYPDATVPESRRGLRNGLAQQLLHEKMVEMQYD